MYSHASPRILCIEMDWPSRAWHHTWTGQSSCKSSACDRLVKVPLACCWPSGDTGCIIFLPERPGETARLFSVGGGRRTREMQVSTSTVVALFSYMAFTGQKIWFCLFLQHFISTVGVYGARSSPQRFFLLCRRLWEIVPSSVSCADIDFSQHASVWHDMLQQQASHPISRVSLGAPDVKFDPSSCTTLLTSISRKHPSRDGIFSAFEVDTRVPEVI